MDMRDSKGRFTKGNKANPFGRRKRRSIDASTEDGLREIERALMEEASTGNTSALNSYIRLKQSGIIRNRQAQESQRQDLNRLSVSELAVLRALVAIAEGVDVSEDDRAALARAVAAWDAPRAIVATGQPPARAPEPVRTSGPEPSTETSGPGSVSETEAADPVFERARDFADLTFQDGVAATEQPTDGAACDGNVTPISWGRERWSHE